MPRDFRLYLDDMYEAIRAIRDYTVGMTFESFAADRKTVDAVVRNLEIIGEAARNLPEEIKDKRASRGTLLTTFTKRFLAIANGDIIFYAATSETGCSWDASSCDDAKHREDGYFLG